MSHSASAVDQDMRPDTTSLFTTLVSWSERTPGATAVSAPDGTLEFRELLRHTRAIAGRLASAGVRRNSTVGVFGGRSRLSVPGLLAVWWLGATAVPVDDGFPANRVNFMLRDAEVRTLLADRVAPGIAPAGTRRVPLSTQDFSAAAEAVVPDPGDCAYIVYTSGTTGWPKGVEITYRGLGTFLSAIASLDLTPGGLGLNPLSPAFDGWLWCTLLYLVHGQGTAIVDLADGQPLDLAERVAAVGPRTVCLPPTLLASCAQSLSTVDTLVVAGERCPRPLLDRLSNGRRVLNVYGPTEATIGATCADSARGDDVHSIGRPLPGYTAHVLAGDGSVVPPGSTGELYLGGAAVARGYRNRPELTAERFVTLPSGERVYRTGDLVLVREDGLLEFAGRLDDQVKVRGFRVEPRELEQLAESRPEVGVAAAFVREDGQTLGLAVVPVPDLPVDAARIRAHLADRLPEVMVPARVLITASLPATPAGKVDRERLAREAAAAPRGQGRGPATPNEVLVCEAWSAVLDRPVTDPDADFFALGGHSLLAARAVASLRERTGIRLSMQDLLTHPTPAALAAELDRKGTSAPAPVTAAGSYLVRWTDPAAARPALLCFPPSGSGCGRYRRWQDALADSGDVIGVQLPGRETRIGEPHPPGLAAVVRAVVGEVLAGTAANAPLVVFGESFGGLIAYEVTRALVAHGRRPAALVVAASEPPTLRRGPTEMVELARVGMAEKSLDTDTVEQVLELVRRDVDLVAGHRVTGGDPGIDVHVWGGAEDTIATAEDLDGWAEFLGRPVSRRQFAGGHVFAMQHPVEIPRLLAGLLVGEAAPC